MSSTKNARFSCRNVLVGIVLATCVAAASMAADDRAQEALDMVDINNVLAGSMFAYDRKDGDAFSAYFAPDGEMRIDVKPNPHVLRGAEIRNIFLDSERAAGGSADRRFIFTRQGLKLAVGENRHLVTGSYIQRVAPDRARHWAYWFWALPGEGGAPIAITEMGNYQDELVKINGKWLFSKRVVTFGPLNPNQSSAR